jgi:hypothetical protein
VRTALGIAALAAVLAVVAPRPAAACDPEVAGAEAATLRAHLDGEARRARRWNLGWAIAFGGLAAAQGALVAAEWTPLGDYDADAEAELWIGAGKATIAMLARAVTPLRVHRPAVTGDGCVDLEAAQRALRATARAQRRTFWLNHLGGLALNVGGLVLFRTTRDGWTGGLRSAALGYPVGIASTYTQPRGSWRGVRQGDLRIGIVRGGGYTGLALGGSF